MAVKMMKWNRASKNFEAKIRVDEVRGIFVQPDEEARRSFSMEIKWKGNNNRKGLGLRRRTSVSRNFTKEEFLKQGTNIVQWDEEFRCLCSFSFSTKHKHEFHPWEVSFTLVDGLKQLVATAVLNLADFADKHHAQISIPLSTSNTNAATLLYLSIVLQEVRNADELPELFPRPVLSFPRSPCYGEMFPSPDKQEAYLTRKASPTRVNIFKGLYVLRAKKAGREEEGSDGRSSDRSDDVEINYPIDRKPLSDTGNDSESEEGDSRVRKSLNYGTLAYANRAGGPTLSNTSGSEDEDWIYYSHRQSEEEAQMLNLDTQVSKRRILPWRKRKLSFRSSSKIKGEPLLRKCYGEEGGDDIDFDRRQLSSSDESILKSYEENSAADQTSAFGDDTFAVGIWEPKEITNRDGHMMLKTQVFFASIDQMNERAAGESACTALVAVISDWLHSNSNEMPIKSQLDSLIREGSLQWRNLCENETYKERFPDRHFDLETVLEAKVRPLSVVPQKSFIGFFQPEGLEDKGLDFLQGVMSFDSIWDEICQCASEMPVASADPLVYIISWNDHFFILKVEHDAYYIIDTLGERLYEGCNQAFILKFDRETTIHRLGDEVRKSDDKAEESVKDQKGSTRNDAIGKNEQEPIEVCTGKESCKEYIKSFLAAIPIRELQVDLKKGLMASTLLHHRLQIEFHYTRCHHECVVTEAIHDIHDTQERGIDQC